MREKESRVFLLTPPLLALVLVLCAFYFGSPRMPDIGKLIEAAAKGNAKQK